MQYLNININQIHGVELNFDSTRPQKTTAWRAFHPWIHVNFQTKLWQHFPPAMKPLNSFVSAPFNSCHTAILFCHYSHKISRRFYTFFVLCAIKCENNFHLKLMIASLKLIARNIFHLLLLIWQIFSLFKIIILFITNHC